jgi:hypothetical protein
VITNLFIVLRPYLNAFQVSAQRDASASVSFLAIPLVFCFQLGDRLAILQRPPEVKSVDTQTTTQLISPGLGIGLLRLGDTPERAIEMLGKPTDDDLNEAPCAPRTVHWYDFANELNGVFAYIKKGRIFQFKVETPIYVTPEGLASNSSPLYVRRFYPRAKCYQLKGSGSKVNGGRDLIYWVEKQKGIAFELRYSYKLRKRLVSYVFVFESNTDFQPEGCVSAPQEWHQLKPFALEVPQLKRSRPTRKLCQSGRPVCSYSETFRLLSLGGH